MHVRAVEHTNEAAKGNDMQTQACEGKGQFTGMQQYTFRHAAPIRRG
jgi:hypothetical protein